jgi:tetratricopeptide (TPR) repeat protein
MPSQQNDPTATAVSTLTQPVTTQGALSLTNNTLAESNAMAEVGQLYLQQAQGYCDRKQWPQAIAACQEALQADPQLAAAYKIWGNVLQHQGDTVAALGYYAKALTLNPDMPEVYSNIGSLYARQKQWQKAISYYQKALEKDANFVDAYTNLALLWQKLDQPDKALACRAMVLQQRPDQGTADEHYQVAQACQAQGKLEQAIAFYRHAIARDAHDIRAYQRLADLLEDQGDWHAAIDCYRQVLDANTQKAIHKSTPKKIQTAATLPIEPLKLPASEQQLLQTLLQASKTQRWIAPTAAQPALPPAASTQPTQQDWPKVIQQLQTAIAKQSQVGLLYRKLAYAFTQNQQPAEATAAWQRAFLLEPNWANADQYVVLGNQLQQAQNPEAASLCYRQALRQQPNLTAAHEQLDRLLNRQKVAESTVTAVATDASTLAKGTNAPAAETTVTEDTATEESLYQQAAMQAHQQGELLREQGRWQDAIAAYRRAIELFPDFSWSHHNLADCYKKVEQWADAAVAYQSAIELNPDFIWSYYSLGEAFEHQANWQAAAQAYRQVLKLDAHNSQTPPRLVTVLRKLLAEQPRHIAYYQETAEQLLAQGKQAEAISAYQTALQIQPNHPELSLALAEVLTQRDPQQAQKWRERAMVKPMPLSQIQRPSDLKDPTLAIAVLSQTHLFDALYYRTNNPEIKATDEQTLLQDYVEQGSLAGYRPNPLFDDTFYRQQYPEVVHLGINPLAHYHCFGHLAGYDPHPYFKTAFYRDTHADVAASQLNPLEHFLVSGAKEGRVAFSAEQIEHWLQAITPTDAAYLNCWQPPQILFPQVSQRVGLYCSSQGNTFIREIADLIAATLTQAGHEVMRLNEQDTPPEQLNSHWIIAPHEFFYLGEGYRWAEHQQWLTQAVMVNVEQPQTSWFSRAFDWLRHAAMVFDINVKSAALLKALGLPAEWLPLGYLPNYAALTAPTQLPEVLALRSLPPEWRYQLPDLEAPLSTRPIDLHFVGSLTARREQFFAQNAHWLSQHQCFWHIPAQDAPLMRAKEQVLETPAVVGLSRRSKILLNIHRDELPYFEWQRLVFHGLWQNTLVVTEPCHDIPGLVAGEHFIACALGDMATTIDWLLNSTEGQAIAERVRWAGHRALKEQFECVDTMAQALRLVSITLGLQGGYS